MVSRLYLVRPFSLFFPRYFHFSFASTNYARLILFISCLSHLDCWSLGSVDHQTDSHLPLPQPWHMLSPDSSFLLPVRAGNSSVYFTLFPSIIFSMLQAPQTTSGRTAKERTWSLTGFPSENTSANWNTHAIWRYYWCELKMELRSSGDEFWQLIWQVMVLPLPKTLLYALSLYHLA